MNNVRETPPQSWPQNSGALNLALASDRTFEYQRSVINVPSARCAPAVQGAAEHREDDPPGALGRSGPFPSFSSLRSSPPPHPREGIRGRAVLFHGIIPLKTVFGGKGGFSKGLLLIPNTAVSTPQSAVLIGLQQPARPLNKKVRCHAAKPPGPLWPPRWGLIESWMPFQYPLPAVLVHAGGCLCGRRGAAGFRSWEVVQCRT